LDLGGTGAKAGVFDTTGKLLGFGRVGLKLEVSAEGYSEVRIEDVYAAARDAVRSAVEQSGASVTAMSVSSQGQTFVALDAQDEPVYPTIIWHDSRAAAQAERMREHLRGMGADSALLIEAISVAPKVMWLREKYSERMSRALKFLLLPDYISYRLIGEAVTDPCTAVSTALYAEDALDYSTEALAVSGIEKSQLARIEDTGVCIGRIRAELAADWGMSSETRFVVGTNDQYAGAIGVGNCRPGIVSETTGTCLALVTLSENLEVGSGAGIEIGRFPIKRYQFAMAYAKTAGVVLQWFTERFCSGMSLAEMDALAADVPVGCNGLTFSPHFDGTVSPRPDPKSRGFIYGLTLSHGPADIYRAILESISFSLRENIEFLDSLGLAPKVVRSIGGGANSDLWIQMKADVTGLPIERPSVHEAATHGAAMIAAVGSGAFSSIEECSQALYRAERVFEPNEANMRLYEEPYRKYLEYCVRLYGVQQD